MIGIMTILSAVAVVGYLAWLSAATPAFTPVRVKRIGSTYPRRRINTY